MVVDVAHPPTGSIFSWCANRMWRSRGTTS